MDAFPLSGELLVHFISRMIMILSLQMIVTIVLAVRLSLFADGTGGARRMAVPGMSLLVMFVLTITLQ